MITLESIENFNNLIKIDKNVYYIVKSLILYIFLIFSYVMFQVI
jgi:hypothetical protein